MYSNRREDAGAVLDDVGTTVEGKCSGNEVTGIQTISDSNPSVSVCSPDVNLRIFLQYGYQENPPRSVHHPCIGCMQTPIAFVAALFSDTWVTIHRVRSEVGCYVLLSDLMLTLSSLPLL